MESNEKQFAGSRVLLWVVIMLLPAIAGIVCIIYSKVALDRGIFWTLAALAAIPAFLGLMVAIDGARCIYSPASHWWHDNQHMDNYRNHWGRLVVLGLLHTESVRTLRSDGK